jgi:replicative DNA helicase
MVDRAVAIALEKVPVFVFSGETGEIGLTDRFLSRLSGIDSKRLRGEGIPLTTEEYKRLDDAAELLLRMPLYINFSATRADQILDLIEETILTERIPLDQEYVIFQDYLQFGNPGDGGASEEYGRLTKVTAEFKFVAKILQRAFVTFSQLKRDTEGDEKPDLDAFKGTGRIEEAADVAMVLAGDRVSGSVAQRWLHNLKQREGEVGWTIRMLMYQAVSQFESQSLQPDTEKRDLFEEEPSGIEEV